MVALQLQVLEPEASAVGFCLCLLVVFAVAHGQAVALVCPAYSLSRSSFQSKVETEVWVIGGKGGCWMRHTFGGGAGVLMVLRDMEEPMVMDDIVDMVGELRPPRRGGGDPRPSGTASSSSTTSSSIATLQ